MENKGIWIKIGEYEDNIIEMFVEDRPSIWEDKKDRTLRITKISEKKVKMQLSDIKINYLFKIEYIADIWRIICPMVNEHLDNTPGYWCTNQDGQGAWFSSEAEIELIDMENNNKYYTPNVEDLYGGYECEILKDFYSDEWIKYICGKTTCYHDQSSDPLVCQNVFLEYQNNKPYVRTKCLDKEDIEKCGWKMVWGEAQCSTFTIEDMILTKFNDNRILIDYSKNRRLFDGECKSINELRKIMGYLNIN